MNIHEAKTQFSKLVERAAAGEEIVIAKAGQPMAKLVPYTPPIAPREGAFLAGQIWESPDCWEPDDELAELMCGGGIEPQPVTKVAEDEVPYRTNKP
ncbi:MAG: type II toxin-antitoxin system Phd/YefM family antitoxin [Verrucomicrobiae bacterium]|nr:type II toxin-antitoxin system Phd/YefM family antitoxin [Verrucomicrobiae bacterium]